MRSAHLVIVYLLAAVIFGCRTTPPRPAAFHADKLQALDVAIEQAIGEKRMPGAVLWLEHAGQTYSKSYGQRSVVPLQEPMTKDTIFDAASLTKVMATTPCIMLLVERGEVSLDAPVSKYIEEFRRDGKEAITVRQLMTHNSGLRAGLSPRPAGPSTAIQMACQEKLAYPPDTKFLYSDINFILLGEIVRRVTLRPLHEFARAEIYLPLKMMDTRYAPEEKLWPRIAPTQWEGTNMLRGIVHDPTARRMDGIAGHAGVFTTAADAARYCRMMLNEGELDGVRLFKPETVRLMTRVHSPAEIEARRGLGWDIDSPYGRRGDLFPPGSYGHTGFTGTALWIDPFSKTFWILLSNRVHPEGKGNVLALQRQISTLCAQSIKDFDFSKVEGALPPRETNRVTQLRAP